MSAEGPATRPADRRALVEESWARAQASRLVPDRVEVPTPLSADEVEAVRRSHPLAGAMPVIRSLLAGDSADGSGIVVGVADAAGRLLWVDGDPLARASAERLRVVPGADWSEGSAGTNAPGTSLALGRTVQIAGEEHFAVQAQGLSCTAAPIRDLETGETLGVVDITGGPEAVGPRSLPLVEATVAAAERELLLQRLRRGDPSAPAALPLVRHRLATLGRDRAELRVERRSVPLTLRHAELLVLLAWHRGGLTAERLGELVHGRPDAAAAIRPEVTRLRRLLEVAAPALVPMTRPYRLPVPLLLDARRVIALLDRGAEAAALDVYRGPLLPASAAPGIAAIREEVAAHLRESLLQTASPDLLLAYVDRVAPDDPGPLLTALQILPPWSPKRAEVVRRLQAIG